jgi:pimeloyl-ACP methyl ester carboxylesterase
MNSTAGSRRHPVRRTLVTVLVVLLATPVLGLVALLVWDGSVDDDPHRELMPGVRLDLRTAATPSGPIAYDLTGGEGPVVLSVHAGLGGADQGRLFADWLRNDGFRILSPSRPGYPGTPLQNGPTLEEQADLLAALLDELDIDSVAVFAASAGSPVAYTFAARYPERVWGLVSISGQSGPVAGEAGEADDPSARATFMNTVGWKSVRLAALVAPQTVVDGTLDETSTFTDDQRTARTDYILSNPETRAFFDAMLETTFPYADRMPGTSNDAEQLQHIDALPLERILAPTLIVHGTQDGDVPFEEGLYAADQISRAERYWMQEDDHLGFWLGPTAELAQARVADFLVGNAPGATRR